MKIGIDIDDTICETWKHTLSLMCEHYGLDLSEEMKSIGFYCSKSFSTLDFENFMRKEYKKFIMDIPLKKNSKEIINRLKEDGHEIVIITARSSNIYENAYDISYNYLKNNGIKFDKLYVSGGDKKDICKLEDIDLFIDDNLSNCLKVSELDIDVLLFETAPCKHYNGGVIDSWNNVYEYVKKKVKYGFKNYN